MLRAGTTQTLIIAAARSCLTFDPSTSLAMQTYQSQPALSESAYILLACSGNLQFATKHLLRAPDWEAAAEQGARNDVST
jgi:hypothetical protein